MAAKNDSAAQVPELRPAIREQEPLHDAPG